jgi:LuxR family maltose regulon positive regulatory protein
MAFMTVVVRASAIIGDWSAVSRHLPAFRVEVGHEKPSLQMFLHTFEAELALHEGRRAAALALLRESATRSAMLDSNSLDATIRTRLALAELADGSPTAAWRALEPLIERIESSGNVGQVLVTGVQGLAELAFAAWGDAASEEGLAALRRWVEIAQRFKAGVQEKPRPLSAQQDAGLSQRELQVLALLTEGQSNKLIARALDLSPHTVKRHVARILDRLELASRMQAADWYRAHVAG